MINELKNKIKKLINKRLPDKETLLYVSDLKAKVLNYVDNDDNELVMEMYKNLEDLEHYIYRYNMFLQANMISEADSEAEKIENGWPWANGEEPIFYKKAEPNPYKYIWHTEPGACKECEALDCTEYEFKEMAPEKPHPNCKCKLEQVNIEEETEDINPPPLKGSIPNNVTDEESGKESSDDGGTVIFFPDDQQTPPLKKESYKIIKEILDKWQKLYELVKRYRIPAHYLHISFNHQNLKHNKQSKKDSDIYTIKVKDINNKALKSFINVHYKVTRDTAVVIPKEKSTLVNALQQSNELKQFIRDNKDDLISGKYAGSYKDSVFISDDIGNTIGKCKLYHPLIDKDGYFTAKLIDLYDFSWLKYSGNLKKVFIEVINDVAFIAQLLHISLPYVIIIPIKINTRMMWGMND